MMLGVGIILMAIIIAGILFGMIAWGLANNPDLKAAANMAKDIDWDAIADEELQSYLPNNKINAIKRYRELTGEGLKEAKDAVEYAIAHPEKKGRGGLNANTGGAGVR